MADGAWVALAGGGIGIAGTLGATYLAHWLQMRRTDRLDAKRKELLLAMLQTGDKWRTLETLTRVIGADEPTTIRLLLEIGARGSQTGNLVWGLISRNPLPESDKGD
ncbi:MAG: hypothetical protein Q8P46_05355 [Hyphomicrobiales bacterium]|nr:hypothetical protein [Hyphomicrobiales bacterium]